MLRSVSPLAPVFTAREVIHRSRSDAALRLSLGTRIGLVTASNDHRVLRLTGSLPLLQKSLAGDVFILSVEFWFYGCCCLGLSGGAWASILALLQRRIGLCGDAT